MIGLTFLAVALLWVGATWWLCKRIPVWLSVQKHPMWLSAVLFPVIVSLPLVDHWVGMWQFQKLCDEQTGLQIYPNAMNAKRVRTQSAVPQLLDGFAIPIKRRVVSIVDLGTNKMIAQYNHFSTVGGRVGGLVRLGSAYECAVFQSNHPEFSKYTALRKQIEFTIGE